MKVVANATPLIALALLDRLELLRQMFDEVYVPVSVYEEVVVKGADRPGADAVGRSDWLQVVSPQAAATIEPMLLGLDAGEMDVLLLAREQDPDWVLIDERLGRRVARAMGMPAKGTLGILLAAVMAGLLSKADALDALDQLTGSEVRISSRWQDWLRDELDRV